MPTSARILLSIGRTTLTKMTMNDKDAASDTYSEVEHYDRTCIAPHGLSVLLGSVDLVKQFSSVTRPSLSRPAESKSPGSRALGVYAPDVSILKDGRPHTCHPEHCQAPHPRPTPLRRKLRWTLPVAQSSLRFISTVRAGYECFVVHCLSALLKENAQWPRLKSIRLYGVDVLPEVGEKYHTPRPQKLLPMVEAVQADGRRRAERSGEENDV